jgi:subtilase family serine protease
MKFKLKPLLAVLPAAVLASLLVCQPAIAAGRPMRQPLDMGATAAAQTQTISIVLKLRNVAQLEQFVAATVNPDSGQYGQFLSVEQFTDLFAPRDRDIERIETELRRAGLVVVEVFRNNMVIRVRGTVAQINAFFNTQLHDYDDTGNRFSKPNRGAAVPDSIKDLVTVVTGLSTQSTAHPMLRRTAEARPAVAGGDAAKVRTTAAGTVNAPGEFTVADVAALYNIQPLYDRNITGRGRTIGIATLATFDPADAYAYWQAVGLKVSPNRIHQVHVDGGAGTDGADETTLDVQQSGGVAPGAKLIVYDAPNTDAGFMDVFYKAAADNAVDTLSVSWGSPEIAQSTDVMDGQHQAFLELAAQGISVFAAAGDSGAYDINYGYPYPTCTKLLSVDAPANDPFVVAAGGTTLPNVQVRKYGTVTVPFERPWAWDYLENYIVVNYGQDYYDANFFPVGGGGGVSVNFARPRFQRATVGTQASAAGQSLVCQTTTGPVDLIDMPAGYVGRNLPDVSLNADPYTGYLVYYQSAWLDGYGGTSFVAPQLNGIAALLGQFTQTRLGHLNPQLYARLAQYGYGKGSPFHSVTHGDNLYWQATPSYNPASGIGTLDVKNLAKTFRGFPQDWRD